MNENNNTQEETFEGSTIAEPRKPTKIEIKRAQQREERRRRLINQGVPEDKVDQVMVNEDYNNLPLDRRFQDFRSQVVKAIQALSMDVMNLQHNDRVIADAMDTNMRAMSKCLNKVGVPTEDQAQIMKDVISELTEERAKQQQAIAEEQQKSVEAQIEEELASAERGIVSSEEPEGSPIPDGATVFGG